jgi:hypothetical protein
MRIFVSILAIVLGLFAILIPVLMAMFGVK